MTEPTLILDGKYRLVRPAGTGGTARVFYAEDTATNRPVAIKVLRRELLSDAEMQARFKREASLLWQLDHPGIVKLVHFEEAAREGLVLVLEWVDGARLDQVIAKGALSGAAAVELLTQLASALGAIHGCGIAHRDLKPENVMIAGSGAVKLLDFGIARFTDPKEAALMFQTGFNKVGGTPAYISPEQAMGRPATTASDVYSLGIVGYQLLSGKVPFTGGSFDVLSAHLHQDPPHLEPSDPAVLEGPAVEVVMQCLSKRPDDRPVDGAAVEALLRAPKRKSRWPFGKRS